MRKETARIYRDAIDTWGIQLQLLMVIEEATELAHAVSKFIRKDNPANLENLAGEMADVKIMIEQLEYGLLLSKEVSRRRKRKLRRLKKRIERSVA